MCGIAGIVSLGPTRDIEEARLLRMRETLQHRGPDGAGLWQEPGVGLTHRRLAIVDPSGGHQPMPNEDEQIWIVYNGEVYNHADLRPALEARGHRYRGRSDTETLLHLYEEDGDALVERLRGMFAFAIWDRARRRLLLARDRLGIKPLYYAVRDRELLFGSEIKALVAAGVRPECHDEVTAEFLASGYVGGEQTLYRDIRRLPPGHLLTWSPEDGMTLRSYWRPRASRASWEPTTFRAETGRLREELTSAVRRHLMSDVPLGVLLSGGVDSTALAALAAGMTDAPLQTFSVGFDDRDADELPYARDTARWLGSAHHEVRVTPRQFFDAVPTLVWHEDEPPAFPSSVPLYFVSALARDHVKVVLTGEGADELFLGYNRYRVTLWNERLSRLYGAVTPRRLRDGVRHRIAGLPPRLRRYVGRSFLGLAGDRRTLVFDNFAVFPDQLRQSLLAAPDAGTRDPYATALLDGEDDGDDLRDRMCSADLQTYLQELLMKQDQMSMAASIESRVPFLDDTLVERVTAMPGGYRLRGWQTKAILRAAVRDVVPPAVLTRRKLGFPVPLGRWLRGEFWPVVEEFVLGDRARARQVFRPDALRRLAAAHRAGAADHAARLWLLITMEVWRRVVLEGEDPAAVMRPVWRRMGCGDAGAVDQDGRVVAGGHRRPAAHVPDAGGAVASARGRRRDDPSSARGRERTRPTPAGVP
jgi:asparagine synthase (glutamine-hydrolysing)